MGYCGGCKDWRLLQLFYSMCTISFAGPEPNPIRTFKMAEVNLPTAGAMLDPFLDYCGPSNLLSYSGNNSTAVITASGTSSGEGKG